MFFGSIDFDFLKLDIQKFWYWGKIPASLARCALDICAGSHNVFLRGNYE